jgi:hypothetical protein
MDVNDLSDTDTILKRGEGWGAENELGTVSP